MKQRVVLELQSGAMSGRKITFEDQALCVLGRAQDCNLVLDDPKISRYHCLLEISPPKISVRDFSSLNGTYINDKLVGKRPQGLGSEERYKQASGQEELHDGDLLRLAASCRIRIRVESCKNEENVRRNPAPKVSCTGVEIVPGYRLIRQIGQGSMGTVYLVEEAETGKELALKAIRSDLKDDPDACAFFRREAETGSQLLHPHIVRQYSFGEHEGKPFFLTDYYPLGTIDGYLRQNPKNVTELVEIAQQILEGLQYLHYVPFSLRQEDGSRQEFRGAVHRDLKPSNLFVSEEEGRLCVKIADFGLSMPCGCEKTDTLIGEVRGSYGFMPRQQILNAGSACPEIDVWAAAATLYYLLTGRYPRPLDSAGQSDPIKCILTCPAVPIRTYRPELPRMLADVIDSALRDSPDFTIRTAAELHRQLEMALDWM